MTYLNSLLKKNKLRTTEARKIIFQILNQSSKALSAQEIFESIKKQSKIKVDLASVYRNLNVFHEHQIIHSLQNGKYSLCQHNMDDEHTNSSHHHLHVIINCNSCGLTREVQEHDKALCSSVSKLTAFARDLEECNSVVLQGLCKNCVD